MIINTGSRTDIPAFYSEWLINRIRAGYVMVRNPYYPQQVTRYRLTPDVVDLIAFCSKNPRPVLRYMDDLKPFRQFWFLTMTPYGKDIEPNVPEKEEVLDTFQAISEKVGKRAMSWRYNPIFISKKYSVEYHIEAFAKMAERLEGYTSQAVISFIDLYEKTKRNFPEAHRVLKRDQETIGEAFAKIGRQHGITIHSCCEGTGLAKYGIDASGCMTKEVLEQAIGLSIDVPSGVYARPECRCVLGHDIGVYNTCSHFCRYCYANYDRKSVLRNRQMHDPESPFLIGNSMEGDEVREAKQKSWISGQMVFSWE